MVDCADQTEQKNEALRMKLRGEVDAKTFREVTAEIDAAHDQLAREHNRLASEAAMPELPVTGVGGSAGRGQARARGAAGRQDHHRSTSPQIDKGWQAPLHHSRHPVARSSARG